MRESGIELQDLNEGSLYHSRDLGVIWQRFDHDLSMRSTLIIVAGSTADPNRADCATRKGQVLGTEDGGKCWQKHDLFDGVKGVYSLAAA